MPTTGESGPHVGGGAAGDAHELIEGRREDVVRVTSRGPYLVELREIDVDDRAQGSGMADRCDAPRGLCNPLAGWTPLLAGMPKGHDSTAQHRSWGEQMVLVRLLALALTLVLGGSLASPPSTATPTQGPPPKKPQ